MKNINIQARISEAKYYLSLGKTDNVLEQILPVLVYLQIPHSIVDRTYVIDVVIKGIASEDSDDFERLKSFLEYMDTESSYHFLNEHGCLELVRMDYVNDLVKAIEDKMAMRE